MQVRRQLARDADGTAELQELEELGMEDAEREATAEEGDGRGGPREEVAKGGGGKGRKKKGRREGLAGEMEEEEEAPDAADAALESAMESMVLPSPGLVALQTRAAFEASEEYRKLNKTQRRKALQQWEMENEHIMEALRAEGKEVPAPKEPKEKKPEVERKKDNTKVHGSGAHSREIKTPRKKKAVYGQPRRGAAADEDSD